MPEYNNILTRMLGADSFPYRNVTIDEKVRVWLIYANVDVLTIYGADLQQGNRGDERSLLRGSTGGIRLVRGGDAQRTGGQHQDPREEGTRAGQQANGDGQEGHHFQ